RVATVPVLDLAETARGEVERLAPSGLAEAARRAHQRGEQPVRMRALEVTAHALGTEHPAVEGEVFPRLEADHLLVAYLELDAALLAAEAAVRLHQPVRRMARVLLEPAGRRVVAVRAPARRQLVGRSGKLSQGVPPSGGAGRWPGSCACTPGTAPA